MSVQTTLQLNQIETSSFNPRKSFDENKITEISQSIKTDGLLQNLVVGKAKGSKKASKKHFIICGERRFRALKLLQANGDIPADYPVKVDIKSDLTQEEILRMAAMENIQREKLSPLDEAEAVTCLLQNGVSIDEVSAQTGLSLSLINRRLKLSNLCTDVKTALREGEINVSQAEALTLGSEDQQKDLLDDAIDGDAASYLKNRLTREKANVTMAIFDPKLYKGTYTSDLFAEDESTYFDDMEQFMSLQEKAIQEKAASYTQQGYDPVEILDHYDYSTWKYRDANAEDNEKGGVIIRVSRYGSVEIIEGQVKRSLDKKTDDATGAKAKATYSKPLIRNLTMHKSIAVQKALLENPRLAKEMAVVQLMTRLGIKSHSCLGYFEGEENQPPAWKIIEAEAKRLAGLLGAENWRNDYASIDESYCADFIHHSWSPELWYEAVKALSNEDLEKLHLFLTVLTFGQDSLECLDTDQDSFFNRLAVDLDVNMKDYWRPDEAFLSRRNKSQLACLIKEAGLSDKFVKPERYKKKELVKLLVEHFQQAKKLSFLPGAMEFPSVDPDALKEEVETALAS